MVSPDCYCLRVGDRPAGVRGWGDIAVGRDVQVVGVDADKAKAAIVNGVGDFVRDGISFGVAQVAVSDLALSVPTLNVSVVASIAWADSLSMKVVTAANWLSVSEVIVPPVICKSVVLLLAPTKALALIDAVPAPAITPVVLP